tara:strand:+ start:369 stop:1139 length:771 start_codon:yes stop_codon:yes gene_type:complete
MEENQTQQVEQANPDNMDVNRVSTEESNAGLLKTTDSEAPKDTGDRPAWLPEKFKTGEDLAKSYSELEKKMTDQPKAPENYDWGFVDKMDLQINNDDATVKEAETMFSKLNMTQDQVEGVIALYKDQLDVIQDAQPQGVDLEQQNAILKEKWGNEYDSRIVAVKKFASKYSPTTLTQPLANTAEGLQIMYDLMSSGRTPNPIQESGRTEIDSISIRNQIAEMRKDDKMNLPQGDPLGDAHRNELYSLYEKLSRAGQ